MNTGLVGAALLVTACILFCGRWILGKRSDIRLAEAFAAALQRMEGMIRWQNLPIERVLRAEADRTPCGAYFFDVAEQMESGLALHKSWQKVFFDIADERIRDCLCRLDLQGDAKQVMGTLHLAAEELRLLGADMRAQQRDNERLCVAVGGCLTAVLVIIFI